MSLKNLHKLHRKEIHLAIKDFDRDQPIPVDVHSLAKEDVAHKHYIGRIKEYLQTDGKALKAPRRIEPNQA